MIPREIRGYNAALSPGDRRICDVLARTIEQHLPGAESKIWHRHPVWFLDGNPIVGYHKLKDCVRLLFWSGRSFDEPNLPPEAGFKTAGARYTAANQIVAKDLKRWLAKSIEIQWDYKNIVQRKGKLLRLESKTPTMRKTVAKKSSDDWRSAMLASVRSLIQQAEPEAVEEVKRRKPSNPAGVAVWSLGGILCTGETYKDKVKLTFAKGASLPDPSKLFNASLDAGTRRAIDLFEGATLNAKAFPALIRAAVAANTATRSVTKTRRSQ